MGGQGPLNGSSGILHRLGWAGKTGVSLCVILKDVQQGYRLCSPSLAWSAGAFRPARVLLATI